MKNLNKHKNLIITIVAVVAIVAVILGVYFLSKLGENKYFREISYEGYGDLLETSQAYIYVGSRKDKETFAIAKEFAENNKLKFKYIYSETLTDKQKTEILGENETVIVYGTEKEVNTYEDTISNSSLTSYFVQQGVLPKTFVKIDIDDYLDLIKAEKSVIVIGRTGCTYCEQFQPVMNEVMKEHDITIYYVDISTLDEDSYMAMYASADFFSTEEWGTPTTLVFDKGKVIDTQSGYSDATTFAKFLQKAGAIK